MLPASLFLLVRGLGAFDSSFPPILHYVAHYEPYILEPSNFGKAWVVYAAMYGVPIQVGELQRRIGEMQGRNEGGHNSPGAESLRGAPKSPNNDKSTFLNTVHLLPKDLR